MILYKSFFRKKSSKIYLFLISGILVSIFLINSFKNYFYELKQEFFEQNSYILVVSENNFDDYFQKADIYSYNSALLFEIPSDNEKLAKLSLKYPDLENCTLILKDDTLLENNIKIGIKNSEFFETGQEINLLFQEVNIKFTVNEIYNSEFAEIKISSELFDQLSLKTTNYVYKIIPKSYDSATHIVEELKSKVKSSDYIISLIQRNNYNATDTSNGRLNNLLNAFYLISLILIVVLILILGIISNNIIEDDKPNIYMYKLLGYSNTKLRINLFNRLFIMNIISIIISVFISNIIIFGCKLFLNLSLNFLSIKTILYLIVLNLFVFLIFTIFKSKKYIGCKTNFFTKPI